jgi:tryptophan synthase beta chain
VSATATPDALGHFGPFGGRFVPEVLVSVLDELAASFTSAWADPGFRGAYRRVLADFGGRPTPITACERLSEQLGVTVLLKREDLLHTGSHKLNNVVGQGLLAVRMGKRRLIAETGAGQHGVATATAAALLGLECTVFMGEVDTERQALNVFRMELLGATVETVRSGSRTLKDAVNEAMREWVTCVDDTHYCLGSAMGPHPFPFMVREFQRVIGDEAIAQLAERGVGVPDVVAACVGGGSNAIGLFTAFLRTDARLVGVEAAGGAAIGAGSPGVLHGMRSSLLQDADGQILEAHSISAGLDYPGVGPEHSYLASIGRAEYPSAADDEVLDALELLARTEGIIAALESAHAIAWLVREARRSIPAGATVLVGLSGRGDKDMAHIASILAARR